MQVPGLPNPGVWERRILSTLVGRLLYPPRNGGPWPVPPGLERVTGRGRDGSTLIGLHAPHADPRGVVVLVHPDRRYGKHWFDREGWFGHLADHGYASMAFDLTPYGESHGGQLYLHDQVLGMVDTARDTHPGVPLHLVGLSLGAFASMNAAPEIPDLDSLTLESPYPTFQTWYDAVDAGFPAKVNRLLERAFTTSYRRIDAGRNIAQATAKRILVAATSPDTVTPTRLSRAVARSAPQGRTTYLELEGVEHLGLFHDARYREALIATLNGEKVEGTRPDVAPLLVTDAA
ncbi:MAG: lysophospholipase [Euryarchaeota archaeon]|nr:lysophospholipase [Euryarchaeota archaeon]